MPRDLACSRCAGTQKALAFGVNPFVAALLGMLTGIGGGVLRDLLVNEIPIVLRADLYALAALGGAGSCRRRAPAALAADRDDDRGRDSVLRHASRGDPPRLESSASQPVGLAVRRATNLSLDRSSGRVRWRAADVDYRCEATHLTTFPSTPSIVVNLDKLARSIESRHSYVTVGARSRRRVHTCGYHGGACSRANADGCSPAVLRPR